jgi:hypothetical protein
MEQAKLPKMSELLSMQVTDEEKVKLFKIWLNQNPPQDWIKKVPVGGGKEADYLPIECVEHLLTTLMLSYNIEVKQVVYHMNAVNVTIRLHYVNPIDKKSYWQDGTAGFEMYSSEKHGGFDKSARTASQAAETFATKDAAEKIGNIFGRNLNRKMQFDYVLDFNKTLESAEATIK